MYSQSIRLLRFSMTHDGRFTGRLTVFPLAEAPPFYTVSYTWGKDKESNTTIDLDSIELPVLPNLVPFMRMVSQHPDFSDNQWWWIDSLCINLTDIREREQQVQLMANIYKRSRSVIVWLGNEVEPGSDCTQALDFLLYLSTLPLSPSWSSNPAAREDQNTIRQALRDPRYSAQWNALSNLLSRPWWSRVWTLQEFVLPAKGRICCGTESMGRSKFKSAIYKIYQCSLQINHQMYDLIPRSVFDSAFNRRRIHQWHGSPDARGISLVAIMAYMGNQLATDPRDKIYSVLGLINARDRAMVGIPEYTFPVQTQFARLVRSFWEQYSSLDIICFSHIFSRYSDSSPIVSTLRVDEETDDWPSWSPDWRVSIDYISPVPLLASQSASEHVGNFRPLHSPTWNAAYDAPGPYLRSRARVEFDVDLTEISCHGVILDTIGELGSLEGCETRCKSFICASDRPFHGILNGQDQLTRPSGREGGDEDPLALVTALTRSLSLDRRDKYLCFSAPIEIYVSEFLEACYACLSTSANHTRASSSPIDPIFSTWLTANLPLRLNNSHTLYSLLRSSTSIPRTIPSRTPVKPASRPFQRAPSDLEDPGSNPESNPDTFLSRFLDTTTKKSRRVMVTRAHRYIGMAPCRARLGDAIVVLYGCSIPLILRECGKEKWRVVGEAYVSGFMNGEVEGGLLEGGFTGRRFRVI